MSDHSYDGTPVQAGLSPEAVQLTGRVPHFSAMGLRLMVVTDVRYIDQPGNRSRRYTEYVCRDLQTGEFVYGCRTLSSLGGIDDGEDNTIAPATQVREGARLQQFTTHTAARDTNGTMVLVGFIEGSRARGVILGSLPHSASTLGATQADGERRLVRHKNTSVEFKQDGTYVITRTASPTQATTITVQPNGDVRVAHHSGAFVHVEDALVTIEAAQVKLGASAGEAVVMGNTADAVMAQPAAAAAAALQAPFAATLALLTAPAGDATTGVPTSLTVAAVVTLLTELSAYAAAVNTAFAAFQGALSIKVKTE